MSTTVKCPDCGAEIPTSVTTREWVRRKGQPDLLIVHVDTADFELHQMTCERRAA